eukprot:m.273242 g.273242  ORF g.273242 m.273242 type:complete len:443 (+) comp40571_c0_seq8:30-1358(+)
MKAQLCRFAAVLSLFILLYFSLGAFLMGKKNLRHRRSLTLPDNPAAAKHDLDKLKCKSGLQTIENYKISTPTSPWLFNWSSDRTYCGAVFNTLQSCVALSSDYGATLLPNYYLSHPEEKLKTRYRRTDIGFVHLPKTGGTSIENLLQKCLPKGRTKRVISKCVLNSNRGFPEQAALSLLSANTNSSNIMKARGLQLLKNAIKLIDGGQKDSYSARINSAYIDGTRNVYTSKRVFGIHNFVHKSRDLLYFTWFRHPISRVLSAYFYLVSPKGGKGGKGHFYSEPIASQSASLADFVRHPHLKRAPQYNNHYIRLLTFGEFSELDSQFDDLPEAMISLDHDLPEIREEHYLAAKRNLETKFAFIGILEEFALSQQMLCQLLGISCPSGAVHANANKHRKPETEINAEDRKILEELNYWDLKLYSHVLNIFEEQRAVYNKQKTAI